MIHWIPIPLLDFGGRWMRFVTWKRHFRRQKASKHPLSTKPTIAHRVLTLVIVGLGYMPTGRKTPAVAQPSGVAAEQARKEIGATREAMDGIIAECEARFGRHVKLLDHPILGPLTATQWRTLHLVHGRHHLKQLLGLRERAARHMG